jgi:hypothetical protein
MLRAPTSALILAQAKADGGVITSFSSVCGGLPAPEAADNPLKYKFSWSPAGVMSAAENSATYRIDGQVVHVPGHQLLRAASPLREGRLSDVFNLEVLPNRDSLPYGELYGLDEAEGVFRGTLRYAGWGALMADFQEMGLTDGGRSVPSEVKDWAALSQSLGLDQGTVEARACLSWLGGFSTATPVTGATVRDAFSSLLQSRLAYAEGERDAVFMDHQLRVTYPGSEVRQLLECSCGSVWQGTVGAGVPMRHRVWRPCGRYGCMREGGQASMQKRKRATGFARAVRRACHDIGTHAFCPHATNALPWQREDRTLSSSLIAFGGAEETIMSRTVGLTASIGLDMLMQHGGAVGSGVLTPTQPEVYNFCLGKLAEEGITFVESE